VILHPFCFPSLQVAVRNDANKRDSQVHVGDPRSYPRAHSPISTFQSQSPHYPSSTAWDTSDSPDPYALAGGARRQTGTAPPSLPKPPLYTASRGAVPLPTATETLSSIKRATTACHLPFKAPVEPCRSQPAPSQSRAHRPAPPL
jgi:hypothetical protein